MKYRQARTVLDPSFRAGVFVVAAILLLGLLVACGGHQPAPVEEQSTLIGKRLLNSDGTYSVRAGDTLYAIAFHYGMDLQELARWNRISSPYVIRPGQKLRMLPPPPGSVTTTGSSAVRISVVKPPAQATTKSSSVTPPPVTPVKSETRPVTVQQKQVLADADPGSWKWPTQGRVLRGYVANNPSRNGLDIAGKEGQAINASAAGNVVYSGNGLIGYGELIIIRHSEKMLSAYAHNKVRQIKEGDQVTGGQKIAEMGRNASDEPLL